jgi:hypothetical protein
VPHRGLNQYGDQVVTWVRSVMVHRRAGAPPADWFPTAKDGPLRTD